ncbi:MFS transporter [Mycobacterium sp. SMC-4]|nr:MFS transporter [Mycobacterium sp. SMC-4]
MATGGLTMSLTAPLEVLYAHDFSSSSAYLGLFMLGAALGVIAVDVLGTRFIPGLDARSALVVSLVVFGLSCIGMGLAQDGVVLMVSRIMQGIGGGGVLGAGLQAAVRVVPPSVDVARSLGRFNVAFIIGGALGAPGGLLVAALVDSGFGYRLALIGTGVFSIAVAAAVAAALPRLDAPPGVAAPRIGLPRFARTPARTTSLVLAMSGEFLRGGVLFTALPLAGAVRGYPVAMITAAIALMSATEIVALWLAYRLIRRTGTIRMLLVSLSLGALCATGLALTSATSAYLMMAAVFGISLAGATASLPVLIVAQVGDSSAGVAKFRISAGMGLLVGSVGCAVLASHIGVPALFAGIAVTLLGCARLAHTVGRRMPAV